MSSAAIVTLFAFDLSAAAETPEYMMAVCRSRAHDELRVRMPDIETKYEGQRVDGTHAVNGIISNNSGTKTFQCSFNKNGKKIVKFLVNQDKPAANNTAMPSKDEQACLQAVSLKTNNGDVVLISTETSEANTVVLVGVGPAKAPWRCLVSRGIVGEVTSLTNEGKL
ncbi:hypothetical protein [Prosthecomicrobium sp. N25]|uniref:hypothetical protein n=1 Tax=Prosthecomicrobium sp. N25 TaxID=3129254 RepID=UPI003076BDA5